MGHYPEAKITTQVKGAIAKMSVVDTRNISRDSLFLMAEIRLDGATSDYKVKVRNLSPGGMLAEGAVPVVPGNRLQICLRNIGWVDGGVAWVQENRFGIAFDAEINPKLARAPANSEEIPDNAHRQFLRSHAVRVGNGSAKVDKLRKI